MESFDINRSNVFCVPFGGISSFNNDTETIIKDLNYKTLLLTENRFNKLSNKDKFYRIMPSKVIINNLLKKIYLKQLISD